MRAQVALLARLQHQSTLTNLHSKHSQHYHHPSSNSAWSRARLHLTSEAHENPLIGSQPSIAPMMKKAETNDIVAIIIVCVTAAFIVAIIGTVALVQRRQKQKDAAARREAARTLRMGMQGIAHCTMI